MNRREFFTGARTGKTNKKVSLYSRTSQTGLQPYTGAWTKNEVYHLLRRTMFGAAKADVDHFVALNVNDAIDELLQSAPVVTPPVRDYGVLTHLTGSYNDPFVAQGSTWINDLNKIEDPGIDSLVNRTRLDSLRKWWVGLMVNQQSNISEKMILFWHHHFSVQQEEVGHPIMMYRYHNLLRQNALGNVRQLTKDVTIDPAMLYHLNGYLNTKLAPDENYARELQELFTVGKGDNSLYTEEDVMEAARVLSGWRVDRDTFTSFAEPEGHDTGTKKFSSFYNNKTISGSSDALQEVGALIDMIFDTRESSRYICRKIYRWFVNSIIDDNVETNVIAPLADVLRANNYEIKPVLEALLKSEHFFDQENVACYIKSPLDLIVGSIREFETSFPAYTDYVNGYPLFFSLYSRAAEMGMDLFQPPDVNGWPAYHQDPLFYEMWVNSNSLPKRANFTNALIADDVVDVRAFAIASSANPADPDLLISDITDRILKYPLSENSKLYIKNRYLLNNEADQYRWTNAWNTNNQSVVLTSLKQLFAFVCNLPEYHLC